MFAVWDTCALAVVTIYVYWQFNVVCKAFRYFRNLRRSHKSPLMVRAFSPDVVVQKYDQYRGVPHDVPQVVIADQKRLVF